MARGTTPLTLGPRDQPVIRAVNLIVCTYTVAGYLLLFVGPCVAYWLAR